jgi:hypothetical protein
MSNDLWEEICFILTETIPSNVSEQVYENKVIRVFEKLGWSQYKKELSVRESIQFGAANRMCPDIIIRNEKAEPVCVIEIKKPSEDLNFSGHINQLSSYMRMLRTHVGILIGDRIKIYTEKPNTRANEIILVEEIPLRCESDKGLKFVEAFKKNGSTDEMIDTYIQNGLEKYKKIQERKELENRINDPGFSDEIRDFIKEKLKENYEPDMVDKVLNNYTFQLLFQNNQPHGEQQMSKPIQRTISTSKTSNNKPTKNGMKIGAYIQTTFQDLFAKNKLNSNDIHSLLDPDYSKRVLNAGFPVLRNVSQGREDHTGRSRYYKDIYGGKYYLSAQWHQFHWDPFEKWLNGINRQNMP